MSQLFMREGRYIDAAALKRYNAGEDIFNQKAKKSSSKTNKATNDSDASKNAANATAGAVNAIAEGAVTKEGIAHYVTEEDLTNNPELSTKVGDLIYIPTPEMLAKEEAKKAKEDAKKLAEAKKAEATK